ncbi:hypothetical protein [Streptomyces sp. NPDC048340]|uniref:hypothetical protein n=1 Tax=Streptomyces sp. NPDC048340 TaxID=3365537 RepID=UPI00371DFD1B
MALPKMPIFPYLQRPIPPWMYRFETREPTEIFKDGFWARGTGTDVARHVADWSGYAHKTGFVSTASDVRTAINMFISWKVPKEDLLKAWKMDVQLDKYSKKLSSVIQRINGLEKKMEITKIEAARLIRLAKLYEEELRTLLKVQNLAKDRKAAAWVEGWMYVVKPSPYYISIEENLQNPRRARFSGPRAVTLSKEATEWDAPYHIPPHNILEASKVRFTRIKGGRGEQARIVHDVLLDIKKNDQGPTKYDERVVYDPFDRAKTHFNGLVGYWAPSNAKESEFCPGFRGFPGQVPGDVWQGKAEYERGKEPRYPFGKPEEVTPTCPAFEKK